MDVTAALLQEATRAGSCAIERHPMIDHVWRERLALPDRLIASDPGATLAFRAARRFEAWRYRGRAVAKRRRKLIVGHREGRRRLPKGLVGVDGRLGVLRSRLAGRHDAGQKP